MLDAEPPPTPRTPRSPLPVTCSASSTPPPASPRLPRRRWPGTPHAAGAFAAEAPPTPRSPLAPSTAPAGGEAEQQNKPVYDCFDVATQVGPCDKSRRRWYCLALSPALAAYAARHSLENHPPAAHLHCHCSRWRSTSP